MKKPLKPCGTAAAYRRHLRHGEPVDAECRAAKRAAARIERNGRTAATRDRSASVVALAVVEAEPIETVNELDEALENLRIIRAVMKDAPAGAIAALSKRREELASKVIRLQAAAKPKENALDELARRRAERLAASAN